MKKKQQYNATNPLDTAIFTGAFYFGRLRDPVVSQITHPVPDSQMWKYTVIIAKNCETGENDKKFPLCAASRPLHGEAELSAFYWVHARERHPGSVPLFTARYSHTIRLIFRDRQLVNC